MPDVYIIPGLIPESLKFKDPEEDAGVVPLPSFGNQESTVEYAAPLFVLK